MTPGEVTAALVGHARRLPVTERAAFLDSFAAGPDGPAEPPAASLLPDIEAFVRRELDAAARTSTLGAHPQPPR